MIKAIVIGLLLIGGVFLYMCMLFCGMIGIRDAIRYPPKINRKPWEGW